MGCLMRAGCLAVLLIAGVAAYVLRDQWVDRVPFRVTRAARAAVRAWFAGRAGHTAGSVTGNLGPSRHG